MNCLLKSFTLRDRVESRQKMKNFIRIIRISRTIKINILRLILTLVWKYGTHNSKKTISVFSKSGLKKRGLSKKLRHEFYYFLIAELYICPSSVKWSLKNVAKDMTKSVTRSKYSFSKVFSATKERSKK